MESADERRPSALEICLAAREFELELFWKRALFFWGFIASAFIGFASTYPDQPVIAIAISCFGAVCSFCWTLANRGSKYWYESWETKAKRAGKEVVKDLFEREEKENLDGLWHAKRFSVSRIAIALSEYTCLLWLVILSYQVLEYFGYRTIARESEGVMIAVLLLGAVLYIGLIFGFARGKTKKLEDES